MCSYLGWIFKKADLCEVVIGPLLEILMQTFDSFASTERRFQDLLESLDELCGILGLVLLCLHGQEIQASCDLFFRHFNAMDFISAILSLILSFVCGGTNVTGQEQSKIMFKNVWCMSLT